MMINLLELARKEKVPDSKLNIYKLCISHKFSLILENKDVVALLLLPMLLDKRYKNSGDSLLQFIEVNDTIIL